MKMEVVPFSVFHHLGKCLLCVLYIFLLSSCMEIHPEITVAPNPNITFEQEPRTTKRFATPEEVEKLSSMLDEDKEYRLGPGDRLSLRVWDREELSDPDIVVGPDGIISVQRIGFINVLGRTREDVAAEITKKLSRFYEKPEVTLAIKEYKNNKAFVLGRVEHPGVVTFPGRGTLLEALSLAGGLPILAEQAFLTKCSIIRGKDTVIWIDLQDLLTNGNMALNARIKNNDVIFIPESRSEVAYVMGEVYKPGPVRLTGQLTLMDALMSTGGPTENADKSKIYLIRPEGSKGVVKHLDLNKMLETSDFSMNFMLHDNDVVYVSRKGIAQFNYILRQLTPGLMILDMSSRIRDLGAF